MECTILVKELDFEIRQVEQPEAGNTGEVSVAIDGAKFGQDARAMLRRSGQPTVEASQATRFNSDRRNQRERERVS